MSTNNLARKPTLFFLITLALAALLTVTVASAASQDAAAPQKSIPPAAGNSLAAPSWQSTVAGDPPSGLQQAETPTLTLAILSSPWATLDHNNPTGVAEEVPQVFVVAAVVTNTGTTTATDVVINLDYDLAGTQWMLLGDEDPERTVDELAPGAEHYVYWLARYPTTIGASRQYWVTAGALNAATVSTSTNYYFNPEPDRTVKTRATRSTGNSGVSQVSSDIVVGVAFSVTVVYDLGTDPQELIFSPVGNPDFDPGAYRLLAAEVRFYNDGATTQQIVYDRLYFPTEDVPDLADNAAVTYTFIGLTPSNTSLCPYTAVGYNSTVKYDQFYCSPRYGTIIPITGTLSLSLTKQAHTSTLQQNEFLTYTLRYTNNGSLPLSYVWFWDDVDPALGSVITTSLVPPGDTDETTTSRAAWYFAKLPASGEPGSTGTLTFTILVDGGGQDLANNTAVVNNAFFGINQDSLPQEAALTSTVTSTVLAPDVTITKSDGQDTTELASPLTYLLRVTNMGSVTATQVVISDVLPAEVTYVPLTATPPETDHTGQMLVWDNLGPIPPAGGSVEITVPVTVGNKIPNGTDLINNASTRYSNPAGWRFTTKTAEDTTTVNGPVLTISKRDYPDPVLTGSLITYTLDYANNGPSGATNVRITDVVPLSTTFASCSGGLSCDLQDGTVTWMVGPVPSSGSESVQFAVRVSTIPETGSLIRNADYGIISDQTDLVRGEEVTTRVNRDAAIFDGHAFVDSNINGQYDSGEATIQGITVTLPSASTPITYTNQEGYYRFRVETEGPITISASLPDGYDRTTPGMIVFADAVLGVTTTVDFGYLSTPSESGVVYGTVFDDENHDGDQEIGESGLAGVEMASTLAVTSPVLTNHLGWYTFRYDAPGTATITETNPANYVSTTPDVIEVAVIMGSDNNSPYDFGDFLGIKIAGQVYDDADVDGAKDLTEGGVADAVVAAGTDSYTTMATGVYTLYVSVTSGDPVLIEETDPQGYVSTNANPGVGMRRVDANTLSIDNPLSGMVYTDGDFGDVLASNVITISGQVWNDNGAGGGGLANGLRDASEPGLAGAVVSVANGLTMTTGFDGLWLLYAPPLEAVTVTETNPDGYVSTDAIPGNNASRVDQDTLLVEPLAGGLTSADNLFGDVQADSVAIITGTVFDDANESGIRDAGEAGLPGVTVTLEISGSQVIYVIPNITDLLGNYQFAVAPGTDVRLTSSGPGGDYYPTTVESLVLRPPTPGVFPDNNFGYSDDPAVSMILGVVFDDRNNSGDREFGEPGLAGAVITLTQNTSTLASVTTGGSGLITGTFTFSVPRPLAGEVTYGVHEKNPAGYRSTTPDTVYVPITPTTAYQEVLFGDTDDPNTASIYGTVFDDLDADGTRDPGDPALPGVVISVTVSGDVMTTTTKSYGQYSYGFDTSEEGFHTVREQDPAKPGYHSTTQDEVVLDVEMGKSYPVDFGDTQAAYANIVGTVFDDESGDGVRDAGELGLEAVLMSLSDGQTTSTGPYGGYSFRVDETGYVQVNESDPLGYHSTTPNTVTVHITPPLGQVYKVNFGDKKTGVSFFGTVFDDVNVNGARDTTELGLEGITVTIEGPFDVPPDPYLTNEWGQYTFLIDNAGVYTTTETDAEGYVSTNAIPGDPAVSKFDDNTLVAAVVAVVPGRDYGDNLFGDVLATQVITVSGSVWDDNGAGTGGIAGDGQRNGDEPGLAGAVVSLSSGLTETTGMDGSFQIFAPPEAELTLSETNPLVYVSTNAIPGDNAAKVDDDTLTIGSLSGGSVSAGNLFGDVLPADLSVSKSDSHDPVAAGTVLTYTVVYSNGGPSYAQSLTLVDTLPDGVNYGGVVTQPTSLSGPTASGQVLTWTAASVAEGVSGTIVLTVTVDPDAADGSTLVNAVTVSSNLPDTVPGDNDDEETTEVTTEADLAVRKEDDPHAVAAGATLTYTLVYTNAGPSDASGVSLTDTLDAGVAFGGVVSQPPAWTGFDYDPGPPALLTWQAPVLERGASGSIVFTVTVSPLASGSVDNSATISSTTPDERMDNNSDTVTSTIGDPGRATILGYVFQDENCNGKWDEGELPVAGVPITLTALITQTRDTDADGFYYFITDQAGVHRVLEGDPAGLFSTTPDEVHVNVELGQTYWVDFGDAPDEAECAAVYGTVFEDDDSDQVWDAAELGIHDVLITLSGGVTDTTDVYGSYTISNTMEGLHTVVETDPDGYISTTPNQVTVTVAYGNGYQVDFGDVLAGLCTCLPDEYEEDDSVAQASALGGERQAHNFCDDATDWTTFSAEAGHVYTVTTSAGGPEWYLGRRADTYLALYDANGNLLAANDDYEGTDDYSSRIVWRAPANGDYYVRITNRAGLSGCLTEYEVWLEERDTFLIFLPIITRDHAVPAAPAEAPADTGDTVGGPLAPTGVITHTCPDGFEVDDTWQQAVPIQDGDRQVHSFDSDPALWSADKDFVWFDAEQGRTITFTTDPVTNTLPLLELYDEVGAALDVTGTLELVWTPPADGRFYLGVSPSPGHYASGCADAAGYELTAEVEPLRLIYLPIVVRSWDVP